MKDLCFLDTSTDKVVEAPFKITGECSGRAQLAQRVMTMLLRATTDPARVDDTGLAQRVGQSNISANDDLDNEFTLALSDISDIIQEDQAVRNDLEEDEILSGLRLEDLTVNEDSVAAEIAIITVDGEVLYATLSI